MDSKIPILKSRILLVALALRLALQLCLRAQWVRLTTRGPDRSPLESYHAQLRHGCVAILHRSVQPSQLERLQFSRRECNEAWAAVNGLKTNCKTLTTAPARKLADAAVATTVAHLIGAASEDVLLYVSGSRDVKATLLRWLEYLNADRKRASFDSLRSGLCLLPSVDKIAAVPVRDELSFELNQFHSNLDRILYRTAYRNSRRAIEIEYRIQFLALVSVPRLRRHRTVSSAQPGQLTGRN